MFIEYPKALYMNGDAEAEMVLAADADDEAAKRADGFRVYGEEVKAEEPAKRKPGRPVKEAE